MRFSTVETSPSPSHWNNFMLFYTFFRFFIISQAVACICEFYVGYIALHYKLWILAIFEFPAWTTNKTRPKHYKRVHFIATLCICSDPQGNELNTYVLNISTNISLHEHCSQLRKLP